MKSNILYSLLLSLSALSACGQMKNVGRVPTFTPVTNSHGYFAMNAERRTTADNDGRHYASLWSAAPGSLLGDRRASELGDLMTVVIEISDKAEISNSTSRTRAGGEKLGITSLFGVPQAIDKRLPDGASSADAVDLSSNSTYAGDGTVRRKENLTLRIAATVTDVLANGHLQIQGSQEVRVNFELRELLVTGFVRPEDISRKNEITYDKIASARISYGGRGLITRVQQPRYGQQAVNIVLPF